MALNLRLINEVVQASERLRGHASDWQVARRRSDPTAVSLATSYGLGTGGLSSTEPGTAGRAGLGAPRSRGTGPGTNLHEGIRQVTGTVHHRQMATGHDFHLQLPRHRRGSGLS